MTFALLGAPGLGERRGPPVEDLVVDKIALHPGVIELTVRNDGPDAVAVRQIIVNDGFTTFASKYESISHLAADTLKIEYPWIEGEAYEIALLTSTGGTIAAEIPVAVESPEAGASFYGLMALLGTYVGVIPVLLGMLWLPLLRRSEPGVIRVLMAFTIGLLIFLIVDALLEGTEVAGQGSQAFGGSLLVYLGAIVGYLTLTGVDVFMRSRGQAASGKAAGGLYLALLVAIGIGLHNLGEGLAIGAAYAAGALALGALLVIGFAIHNTTEGLAVVAPVARNRPSLLQARRPRAARRRPRHPRRVDRRLGLQRQRRRLPARRRRRRDRPGDRPARALHPRRDRTPSLPEERGRPRRRHRRPLPHEPARHRRG